VIFIPGISIFTHFIHNFRLGQIAPIKKIRTSDIPFLIIQGEKDKPVPPKMAEQLYSQAKVEQKNIIMIPEAPHAKAFEVDFMKVQESIIDCVTGVCKIKKRLIKKIKD
jgi:fermentation-respiration switch protein FrsA (DUF1100 family)